MMTERLDKKYRNQNKIMFAKINKAAFSLIATVICIGTVLSYPGYPGSLSIFLLFHISFLILLITAMYKPHFYGYIFLSSFPFI